MEASVYDKAQPECNIDNEIIPVDRNAPFLFSSEELTQIHMRVCKRWRRDSRGVSYYLSTNGDEVVGEETYNRAEDDEKFLKGHHRVVLAVSEGSGRNTPFALAVLEVQKVIENGIPTRNEELLTSWGVPASVAEVYKSRGVEKLRPSQIEALKAACAEGPNQNPNFLLVSETSSGKSLVSEILVLRSMLYRNTCRAIIMLPYIALCTEREEYLKSVWMPLGLRIGGDYNSRSGTFDVTISTIESANVHVNALLLDRKMMELSRGLILVCDEIHMIRESNSRGSMMEMVLSKLLLARSDLEQFGKPLAHYPPPSRPIQILGMSATLSNIEELAIWLQARSYDASDSGRPIILKERFVYNGVVYDRDGRPESVLLNASVPISDVNSSSSVIAKVDWNHLDVLLDRNGISLNNKLHSKFVVAVDSWFNSTTSLPSYDKLEKMKCAYLMTLLSDELVLRSSVLLSSIQKSLSNYVTVSDVTMLHELKPKALKRIAPLPPPLRSSTKRLSTSAIQSGNDSSLITGKTEAVGSELNGVSNATVTPSPLILTIPSNDECIVRLVAEKYIRGERTIVFCRTRLETVTLAKFLALRLKFFSSRDVDVERRRRALVKELTALMVSSSQGADFSFSRAQGAVDVYSKDSASLGNLGVSASEIELMAMTGVFFHNASLNPASRALIEASLRSNPTNKTIPFAEITNLNGNGLSGRGEELLVVVATSTLAMGVNLPATRVIFKSIRNPAGKMEDISSSLFRQMAGRAGRQGLSSSGDFYVLVEGSSVHTLESDRNEKATNSPFNIFGSQGVSPSSDLKISPVSVSKVSQEMTMNDVDVTLHPKEEVSVGNDISTSLSKMIYVSIRNALLSNRAVSSVFEGLWGKKYGYPHLYLLNGSWVKGTSSEISEVSKFYRPCFASSVDQCHTGESNSVSLSMSEYAQKIEDLSYQDEKNLKFLVEPNTPPPLSLPPSLKSLFRVIRIIHAKIPPVISSLGPSLPSLMQFIRSKHLAPSCNSLSNLDAVHTFGVLQQLLLDAVGGGLLRTREPLALLQFASSTLWFSQLVMNREKYRGLLGVPPSLKSLISGSLQADSVDRRDLSIFQTDNMKSEYIMSVQNEDAPQDLTLGFLGKKVDFVPSGAWLHGPYVYCPSVVWSNLDNGNNIFTKDPYVGTSIINSCIEYLQVHLDVLESLEVIHSRFALLVDNGVSSIENIIDGETVSISDRHVSLSSPTRLDQAVQNRAKLTVNNPQLISDGSTMNLTVSSGGSTDTSHLSFPSENLRSSETLDYAKDRKDAMKSLLAVSTSSNMKQEEKLDAMVSRSLSHAVPIEVIHANDKALKKKSIPLRTGDDASHTSSLSYTREILTNVPKFLPGKLGVPRQLRLALSRLGLASFRSSLSPSESVLVALDLSSAGNAGILQPHSRPHALYLLVPRMPRTFSIDSVLQGIDCEKVVNRVLNWKRFSSFTSSSASVVGNVSKSLSEVSSCNSTALSTDRGNRPLSFVGAVSKLPIMESTDQKFNSSNSSGVGEITPGGINLRKNSFSGDEIWYELAIVLGLGGPLSRLEVNNEHDLLRLEKNRKTLTSTAQAEPIAPGTFVAQKRPRAPFKATISRSEPPLCKKNSIDATRDVDHTIQQDCNSDGVGSHKKAIKPRFGISSALSMPKSKKESSSTHGLIQLSPSNVQQSSVANAPSISTTSPASASGLTVMTTRRRLCLAMLLGDLLDETPFEEMEMKWGSRLNFGGIQSVLQSLSSYATSVMRICDVLWLDDIHALLEPYAKEIQNLANQNQ